MCACLRLASLLRAAVVVAVSMFVCACGICDMCLRVCACSPSSMRATRCVPLCVRLHSLSIRSPLSLPCLLVSAPVISVCVFNCLAVPSEDARNHAPRRFHTHTHTHVLSLLHSHAHVCVAHSLCCNHLRRHLVPCAPFLFLCSPRLPSPVLSVRGQRVGPAELVGGE